MGIDTINLEDFNIEFLRKNISVVSQDIALLNDSVYNNITQGDRDITYDSVVHASKVANIYDTILAMERGFDTVVGDRGIRLSGGQKQRLSIARAIIKKRPIIVFDEATSALDNINELAIYNRLLQLFKNQTIIVIAHRLTTIEKSDIIYVLDHGRLAEQGTHKNLLERKGVYYNLYNKENKSESDNNG